MAACRHLATAARVKYPAALQHCKFDTPLLAVGFLILKAEERLIYERETGFKKENEGKAKKPEP